MPLLQSVQERMSRKGGHGYLQSGVSRAALQRPHASAAALSLRFYGPVGEVCIVCAEPGECGTDTARRGDTGEARRRHFSTTHPSPLCQTQLPKRTEQDSGEREGSGEDGSALARYLE